MSQRNNYMLEEYNLYDSDDNITDDHDYDFYHFDGDDDVHDETPGSSPRIEYGSPNAVASDGRVVVPPPLPLCFFNKDDSEDTDALTIAGKKIRHIDHYKSQEEEPNDILHNPMICR